MRQLLCALLLSSGCTLLLSGALAPRVCGDGLLDREKGEVCDDGNTEDGDGCRADCLGEELCGDSLVDANEGCDDGNQSAADGCEPDCTPTPDFCGNAIQEPPEQCDDGNAINGDGCSTACILETCGDGVLDVNEGCDDNNDVSNDGCSRTCFPEADLFVFCDDTNGDGSVAAPFNTIAEAHNAASAGQTVMILPGSPECAENVAIAKTLTLQGLADPTDPNAPARPLINGSDAAAILATTPDTQIIVRGLSLTSAFNGATIQVSGADVALLGVEISNTGANNNSNGVQCDGNSQVLIDQSILRDNFACGLLIGDTCQTIAANSLFQRNGNVNIGNRGAIRINNGGSGLVMRSTFDNNIDADGIGVMQCSGSAPFHQADSIVANNNNGNNVFDAECDLTSSDLFGAPINIPGNTNADPAFLDAANGDFHLRAGSPAIDAASVVPPLLFDPISVFGVDILSHDFAGSPRPIGAAPDMGMFEAPLCGDGLVDLGQECDDGNNTNNDACDQNCTLPACGNGITAGIEECDDNNNTDGDGCTAICQLENCGDGLVNNNTEVCDDANTTNGDGCDNDCQLSCGNGAVDVNNNEECDDNDNDNNDGCDQNCKLEFCGDGIVNDGIELCDDANATNGDGCNAQCLLEPIFEVEPNEDGSPQTGGVGTTANDFSSQNALNNGLLITESTAIQGALFIPGDEDVYAVQNLTGNGVSLRIETISNLGTNTCTFDSVVAIRDAGGGQRALDDDGGAAKCSRIQSFFVNPGETVFVHVFSFNDLNQFGYFLIIVFE